MDIFFFLFSTIMQLLIGVFLLRFWLQAVRADFYNPISQAIIKLTNPILLPLGKFIPKYRQFDLPAILVAYLLAMIKFAVILKDPSFIVLFLISLFSLLKTAGVLTFWILIIQVIQSFIGNGYNANTIILHQLVAPIYQPIQKRLPNFGGLDFTPMVIILSLQVISMMMGNVFQNLWVLA